MKRPPNARLVLLVACLLPGVGHVMIGRTQRGLAFAFFTLVFMVLTYLTTTPDQSFLGRHAGGLFIWALSLPDAYRRARIDQVTYEREHGEFA
jgi:hypothetical protein